MAAMVDAAPARDHIRRLVAEGMTQQAICRAAAVTQAALSALLHGGYEPGRPPQKTIYGPTADRLLAVEFEAPAPRRKAEPLCAPGDRFETAGYRVGRCTECGQLAPVHLVRGESGDRDQIVAHDRAALAADAEAVRVPTLAAVTPRRSGQPEHGTLRGHERHRRAKEKPCDLCQAAKRGYEQARRNLPKIPTGPVVSEPLAKALLAACRSIVLRRPLPRIRELAAHALQVAAGGQHDADASESEAA